MSSGVPESRSFSSWRPEKKAEESSWGMHRGNNTSFLRAATFGGGCERKIDIRGEGTKFAHRWKGVQKRVKPF